MARKGENAWNVLSKAEARALRRKIAALILVAFLVGVGAGFWSAVL